MRLPVVLVLVAVSTGALAVRARAQPPAPARVWVVDNTAPAGGDGSRTAPLPRLALAEQASGPGDVILVLAGDGTSRGLDEGITLQRDQRLIGEHVGFARDGQVIVAPGRAPTLTATARSVIQLAGGVEVAGVIVSATTSSAIAGTGASGAALRSVSVTTTAAGRPAITFAQSGNVRLADVSIDAMGGHGLALDDVADLTLDRVRVSQHGGGVSLDAVHARRLQGAVTITSSTFASASDDVLDLGVHDAQVHVTQSTIGGSASGAAGNDGLRLSARGHAVSLRIADSTFTQLAGDGLQVTTEGTDATHVDVAVTRVRFHASPAGGQALTVDATGPARVRLEAAALDTTDHGGGVVLGARDAARLTARLDGRLAGVSTDTAAVLVSTDDDGGVDVTTGDVQVPGAAPVLRIEAFKRSHVRADCRRVVRAGPRAGADVVVAMAEAPGVCVAAPPAFSVTVDEAVTGPVLVAGASSRVTPRVQRVAGCPEDPE